MLLVVYRVFRCARAVGQRGRSNQLCIWTHVETPHLHLADVRKGPLMQKRDRCALLVIRHSLLWIYHSLICIMLSHHGWTDSEPVLIAANVSNGATAPHHSQPLSGPWDEARPTMPHTESLDRMLRQLSKMWKDGVGDGAGLILCILGTHLASHMGPKKLEFISMVSSLKHPSRPPISQSLDHGRTLRHNQAICEEECHPGKTQ